MDTKALRQKILDLAIRGKLVPQDPNDEPASVLLERIRAEKQQMVKDGKLKAKDIKNDSVIFLGDDSLHYEKFPDGTIKCIEDEIPFELPEGWEWTRLSNIASFFGGKTPPTSKAEYWGNEYLWITSKDMKSKYIDSSQISLSKKGAEIMQIIKPDTLLLVARSGILRHTLPVAILKQQATINQDIKAISLYDSSLVEFVYSYLKGMESRILLKYTKSGTTVENINFDEFKQIIIPLPPKAEQIQIIQKINTLVSFIESIEFDKTDLQATIQLTKSKILDLAIKGKLVPQNPDDEPASVLLDHIRAEKEELIRQGKIKRDKKESVIFRGDDNSYFENIENKKVDINDEIPFNLPQGWAWTRLQMICDKLVDGAHNPPKGENHKTDYIMLSSTNINNDTLVEMQKVRYLNKQAFEKENNRTNVKVGDILFTSVGSLGRSCIYAGNYNLCFQRSVSVISTLIYNSYLKYYFDSPLFQNKVNHEATGTAQKGFYLNQLANCIIAIPPLNEQKRIADKVSQLFSQLDFIAENIS